MQKRFDETICMSFLIRSNKLSGKPRRILYQVSHNDEQYQKIK